MAGSVKPRIYVWRMYLRDYYFMYCMDVTGKDMEEAVTACERQLKNMEYDNLRIIGNPDKISTFRAYCGNVLYYLIPVDEIKEDENEKQ